MWLFPTWFLFVNGIFLLILGGLILWNRFRNTGNHPSAFRKSSGLLWAFLCMSMGIVLFLMGFGYIPQPGMWLTERKEQPLVFPSGR